MLKHRKILATVALSVLVSAACRAEAKNSDDAMLGHNTNAANGSSFQLLAAENPTVRENAVKLSAGEEEIGSRFIIETKALAKDLQNNPFKYLQQTVQVQKKLMHEFCYKNPEACASVGKGLQFLNPEAFKDEQTKRKVAILNGLRDVVLNLSNAALACAPEDVSGESCAAMLEKASFGLFANARFNQGKTLSSRELVAPVGVAFSVKNTKDFLNLIEGSANFLSSQVNGLPKVDNAAPVMNSVHSMTENKICSSLDNSLSQVLFGIDSKHTSSVSNGETFLMSTHIGEMAAAMVEVNLAIKNLRQMENAQKDFCASPKTQEDRKNFEDRMILVESSALKHSRYVEPSNSLLSEGKKMVSTAVSYLVEAAKIMVRGDGNAGDAQPTAPRFPAA